MEEEEVTVLPGSICFAAMTDKEPSPAEEREKLSFKKGDVLTIVNYNKTESVVSNSEGTVGVVPTSSLTLRSPVSLSPMIWYHCCTRDEAEGLLDKSIEGQFLVRPSQTSDSVYAISVSTNGLIQHYLIASSAKNNQLTLDGKEYFSSLPELIQFYGNCSSHDPKLSQPLLSKELLKYYVDKQELKESWGLTPDDLEILKSVGKGEFGEVNAGVYRGYQVAVKTIFDKKDESPEMQSFVQEAAILTHLRHKNIVQLVGVVFENLTMKHIVLEFMSKGSVGKYLATRGRSVVAQNELLNISRDICEGMIYVSSRGFVHRDLAARNILLNYNGQAKISDFGLARKVDAHAPHEEVKFPIKWTAPEGLKDKIFSEKSDVWSFGVCLWEVYSFGRVPYPSILSEDVLEQIEDGYIMDPPDNCPSGVYSIMKNCWSLDPETRPDFRTLRALLSKSFGESKTPCSSPSPARKAIIATNEKVKELLSGPVASKIYLEAPAKQSTILHLANLVMIGPRGGGKTSLLRCLCGNQFRQREDPTTRFYWSSHYYKLVSHRTWEANPKGLAYDNELSCVVINNLLKDAKSLETPPPLPPMRQSPPTHPRPTSVQLPAPPLLPPRPPSHRMSMLLESTSAGDASSDQPMKSSGSHPEGLNTIPPKEKKPLKRRFSFNRLFRKSSTGSVDKKDAVLEEATTTPPPSPPLPPRQRLCSADNVISSKSSSLPEATFISAIPDNLMTQLKEKINDCANGTLPPEVYGRVIDTPTFPSSSLFKSLLITKSSIILLVFDTSHDNPVPDILSELNSLFTLPLSPVSIILVGTHSDKHPTHSVAKQQLDKVRQTLRATPYGKYLASGAFIVSCSSVFDQSTIEDVKKYVTDMVKSKCRKEVPLKWLRCLRRFQSLSSNGQYFISLTEAESIIKEVCMIKNGEEEVREILLFLHDNLVILYCPQLKSMENTIITDPAWFLGTASKLLGLDVSPSGNGVHPDLKADYHLALTQGALTDALLEHLCPSVPRSVKQELLLLLQSLELAVIHSMRQISLSESDRSSHSSPIPSPTLSLVSSSNTITGILIPSIINESLPPNISPSSLETIYFLSPDNADSSLVFLRLLVRCLSAHSSCYSLYKDAGCFLINPQTMLLVRRHPDQAISVSLHPSYNSGSSPSLSPLSSTEALRPSPPSIETALTVLMFIKPALDNICQVWTSGTQYLQAFKCDCTSNFHYMIVDEFVTSPMSSLKCQRGTILTPPILSAPWFGEEIQKGRQFSLEKVIKEEEQQEEEEEEDNDELVNATDIDLITEALQSSWTVLGDAIGASPAELDQLKNAPDTKTEELFRQLCSSHLQSSPFLDLVSNLDDIGHAEVADSLIDFRMKTSGIAL
uniref:Tyrosine-protein kinase n=1 Tax=Amphimedon queenslandica TaxID=400682 RepID=A0A1X7UVQ9_AMPQE